MVLYNILLALFPSLLSPSGSTGTCWGNWIGILFFSSFPPFFPFHFFFPFFLFSIALMHLFASHLSSMIAAYSSFSPLVPQPNPRQENLAIGLPWITGSLRSLPNTSISNSQSAQTLIQVTVFTRQIHHLWSGPLLHNPRQNTARRSGVFPSQNNLPKLGPGDPINWY